jgi:hypothetical protein
MALSEEFLQKWDELKVMVDSLEKDVVKNSSGNSAASVRVRKGLRDLSKFCKEVIKVSSEVVKAAKDTK